MEAVHSVSSIDLTLEISLFFLICITTNRVHSNVQICLAPPASRASRGPRPDRRMLSGSPSAPVNSHPSTRTLGRVKASSNEEYIEEEEERNTVRSVVFVIFLSNYTMRV